MTTGVRPALLREDWHWAGPPPSRKSQTRRSPDAAVAGILRHLGHGAGAVADSQLLAPRGGGLYDQLFFENASGAAAALVALGERGTRPADVAALLGIRCAALEEALAGLGYNPTYFRDPAVLLADRPAGDSRDVTAALRLAGRDGGEAVIACGDPIETLMLCAAVVDSLIDDVAYALGEGWTRADVWNLVFPGTPPRGAERPTWR